MADASEDTLNTTSRATEDEDISDETQDFRFLLDLTSSATPTIPKRGEKDFEPNPTEHQASLLDASREAMQTALSFSRMHNPKSQIVGIWHSDSRLCSVAKPSGPHFQKMGFVKRGNSFLLPEEMLYLLERGNLDVRWGDDMGNASGLPMSLQAAYAVVIGDQPDRMSREHWVVWSGLRRAGYVVIRCPEVAPQPPKGSMNPESEKGSAVGPSSLWPFFGFLKTTHGSDIGPLVKPGLYRNYNDMYRKLELVKAHSPHASQADDPLSVQTAFPFKVCFHVYKPVPGFRKSNPGPPDFRIAVVDAPTTSTPTLAQLSALLESTPFTPPPKHMATQNMQKLRHGYRNVILAVVDQGVVSYLRLTDAAFGEVKIYNRGSGGARGNKGKRGGKGGRGGKR